MNPGVLYEALCIVFLCRGILSFVFPYLQLLFLVGFMYLGLLRFSYLGSVPLYSLVYSVPLFQSSCLVVLVSILF